jgi:hypothetical protein
MEFTDLQTTSMKSDHSIDNTYLTLQESYERLSTEQLSEGFNECIEDMIDNDE